jgi:hypothetical protein
MGVSSPDVIDAKIRLLMARLCSLHEGEAAVLELIACGSAAIGPLRELLLSGNPSNVFEPRRRVVEVLACLGARETLIEYLNAGKDIPDPDVRLGEEAVEAAAARELAAFHTEEDFHTLLDLARGRPSAGILEALGEFRRIEAIPYLVMALEDDMCRPFAERALRKLGRPAQLQLLEAAITPSPSHEYESPSSILRRRGALRVLSEIGIESNEWLALRPLLEEQDPVILVTASRIGSGFEGGENMTKILRRLLAELPKLDWLMLGEAEALLLNLAGAAKPFLDEEIARRTAPSNCIAWDPILALLLRLRQKIEEARDVEPEAQWLASAANQDDPEV